jgi:undecaprenyl diphosphate synthase
MTVVPFPASEFNPRHVAIVMDGNRRWASNRMLPKAIGHANGARRIRQIVQGCKERGIRYLTLFAFSTENWQRPAEEVASIMGLFAHYLEKEVADMNDNGVCLKVSGDRSGFDARLRNLIDRAEADTAQNTAITLTIAANYGGRRDILQAMQAWMNAQTATEPAPALDEDSLRPFLSMAHAPDPDLLIRTGGESRISNFMLWQLAYSELYFTDVMWPDFTTATLDEAIAWFQQRDRRFGGCARVRSG